MCMCVCGCVGLGAGVSVGMGVCVGVSVFVELQSPCTCLNGSSTLQIFSQPGQNKLSFKMRCLCSVHSSLVNKNNIEAILQNIFCCK